MNVLFVPQRYKYFFKSQVKILMNRFLFLTIYRGYFVAIVARGRANRRADREIVLVTKVDTLDFKLSKK
jgi:hypothetical protein